MVVAAAAAELRGAATGVEGLISKDVGSATFEDAYPVWPARDAQTAG